MTVLARPEVVLEGDERPLNQALSRAERSMRASGRRLEAMGRSLFTRVTLPLVGLGTAAVKSGADLDSLRRGLEAVAGSATAAGRQLERLRAIAKLPAVDLNQAAQASIAFQAIGRDAAFAERMIRGVANAVALSGGSAPEFAGVMRQMRQIASLGRLMGEEMNVILENAPAMARAIQLAFGTTSTEAIRSLGLTTDQFFERLFQGMEALPQVSGGAANALQNLWQAMRDGAAAVGDVLLPSLLPLIDGLTSTLEGVREIEPATIRSWIALGGVAAVAPVVVMALGNILQAVSALSLALKVGLLPLLGIGGLVVGGLSALSYWFIRNKLDALAATDAAAKYAESLKGVSRAQILTDRNLMARQLAVGRERGTLRPGEEARLVLEIAKLDNHLRTLENTAGSAIRDGIISPLVNAAEAAKKLAEALEKLDERIGFKGGPRSLLAPELAGGMHTARAQRTAAFQSLMSVGMPVTGYVSPRSPAGNVTANAGEKGGALSQAFGALIPKITMAAGAFMVLKPIFDGFAATIGPAMKALAVPLKTVGSVLGTILLPALRLLFNPLKYLGVAVSWVAEQIQRAIGAVLSFIGRVPGLGGLRKLGRAMEESADAIRAQRKELEGMTFTSAMDGATEAVQRFTETLTNVPNVLPLAAHRFRITSGFAPSPVVPRDPMAGMPTDPGRPGHPTNPPLDVHIHLHGEAAIVDRVEARVLEAEWRSGTTALEGAL